MPKAAQKPRQNVDRAVEAYHHRKELDPNAKIDQKALAAEFDCHPTTLSRHLSGKSKGTATAFASLQKLTVAEESTLADFLRGQARYGKPLTQSDICAIANDIILNRLSSRATPQGDIDLVSDRWAKKFLKRHPQLKIKWSHDVERPRVQRATRQHFELYFQQLNELCQKHHYRPENIWNFDETGWGVGSGKKEKVLVWIDKEAEQGLDVGTRSAVLPQGQEWVTAIEAISAAGDLAPPMLIVKQQKGKAFQPEWVPEGICTDGWAFTTSTKGWSNLHIGLLYLDHFIKVTTPAQDSERRLLIVDGHSSHFRYSFAAKAMAYDIDIIVLPPHSSHIAQPLDVSVFGPYKKRLRRIASTAHRYATGSLPKPEWIKMIARARMEGVGSSNIKKGFEATGIYPYDPERLYKHCVEPSTPPRTAQPLPRTPQTSLTSEIDQFIESQSDEISPVASQKIRELAEMSESERARNVLLAGQVKGYEEYRGVKRKGLTTSWLKTHHITDPTALRNMREMEIATADRKERKRLADEEKAFQALRASREAARLSASTPRIPLASLLNNA